MIFLLGLSFKLVFVGTRGLRIIKKGGVELIMNVLD